MSGDAPKNERVDTEDDPVITRLQERKEMFTVAGETQTATDEFQYRGEMAVVDRDEL